jgi:hypothetical protein
MFWTFTLAVVAFAVTLSMRWFMPVLIAAFPIEIICIKLFRRPITQGSAVAK